MSPFPITLLTILSVAACAPMASSGTPPEASPPENAPPSAAEAGNDTPVKGPEPPGIVRLPEGECAAEPAQHFVGRKADSDVVQAAMDISKARQVRVIKPGMMVTMDFRSDRLNIRLDDAGKIVSITCG